MALWYIILTSHLIYDRNQILHFYSMKKIVQIPTTPYHTTAINWGG